jgi:hypothetical protein
MQLRAKASKALLALTLAVFAVFSIALTQAARAQAITGSIAGRVIDPSGAVVANAIVTIRNTDMFFVCRTYFSLQSLSSAEHPGSYEPLTDY